MKGFDRDVGGEREIKRQTEHRRRQEERPQSTCDELLTVTYAWRTDICEGIERRKVGGESRAKSQKAFYAMLRGLDLVLEPSLKHDQFHKSGIKL